jgi:hypothetical protein
MYCFVTIYYTNGEVSAISWETVIALCALFYSIYSFRNQQSREEKLNRAMVKPLLDIKSLVYENNKAIILINKGLGPAIIRKANFCRDGEIPTNEIVTFFDIGDIEWDTFTAIVDKKAISPGDEVVMVQLSEKNLIDQGYSQNEALNILKSWQKQKIGIHVSIEYENIFGNVMESLEEELL